MSNFFDEEEEFNSGSSKKAEPLATADEGSMPRQGQTLRECVTSSLNDYLTKVDSEHISELYDLVLSEVEAPLLESVMQYTRSNQSKASAMLGLNRGTLRKKLKKYGMLN